ncbi:MAG: magnesium transporter [Sphingobacteriia bacterium]|nr:magnesium transporter [Sphingobacteriia bacterium]NCC40086.1 magnesium transporter [Gammaproteobacteria bacterium]
MQIDIKTEPQTAASYSIKKKRLVETINRLYRRNARVSLGKILSRIHPADLAAILDELPLADVAGVFNLIPDKVLAADVFNQLSQTLCKQVIAQSPAETIAVVLKHLPPDDLADLIGDLPEEQSAHLMALLDLESKREIESLLKYDPSSAGGIMTTDFFALPQTLTVEEAIENIRGRENVEMIFYLYLTDEAGHLVGVVSLRQLLLAPPGATLRAIMNPSVLKVSTDTDETTVAMLVDKYRLLAMPVVDDENILVGMVTVDDVIDVMEEETTRGMLKMAGTSESEIFTQSTFKIAGIRLPWLFAAFLGGIGATYVIGRYEEILAQIIILSAFVPVIIGMAGNVGVQSATVTVRGLATGSIDLRDTTRLIFKELRIGFLLGTFYGVILALFGYFFHDSLLLGQTVGLTILINMTGAALLAVALPMLFVRLKVDPAVATGPFVTTAIDVLGVLNYFLIASLIYGL